MKDELHKQVLERLAGKLDGDLFEACVVDLLQPVYPSLTPVEGGGDDGRDGHFFTINGATGPLVCTTGADVIGNLRRNLKEYVRKGHEGRSAILATSQALTPTRRNNLENAAKEAGFRLINIHDQADIALRLYRESAWLKRLLNLESRQQALSAYPVSPRPVISLAVIGREDTLDWLGKTTSDCLIVGQPGSGKTFAVRDFIMSHEGLFVVSDDSDQIIAEIRAKEPAYLVVDDAHTKLALLQSLRQIREDTGASYTIIATSWISSRVLVQNELALASSAVHELELLGQDTIVAVITDCGIKGPNELLYQMVRQAEGKPGLAATLSQLVLAGDAMEVFLGDALGKHLEALFEKSLGAEALDLLAVVAMGGDSGITLENAAIILGTSEIKVQRLATQFAFGGVITELPPDTLIVRPRPLRYSLAKQRFFNGRASVNPFKHLARYNNFRDVVEVALNAALRGGSVDTESLYELIQATGNPELLGGFAALGQAEAQRVLSEHPDAVLKAPGNFLHIYPEGALPILLESAVGDNRPLHSTPEHPLRHIQDWCRSTDPNREDPLMRRKALLRALTEWRKASKDPEVFTQALISVFDPHFEFHSMDPGAGRTLTITSGHLSSSNMHVLLHEWAGVTPLLVDLSPDSWYHLIELLHEWAYQHVSGYQLGDAQTTALEKGARLILDDLAQLSSSHPGIQSQLRQIAHHLRYNMKYAGDRDYDIVFAHEDDHRSYQKNSERHLAAVQQLAVEYAAQPPEVIVQKVAFLHREAQIGRHTWPDYTLSLATALAKNVQDLPEWTHASVEKWDNPSFSSPFLVELHAKDPARARPALLKALDHDRHRFAAAEIVLQRPFQDDELWRKTEGMLSDMTLLVETMTLRGQIDEETTRRLLEHTSDEVAMMAAVGLEHAYDGYIPPALYEAWEAAIIGYEFTDGHRNDHGVGEALKRHPHAIVKWLLAKVSEKSFHDLLHFSREADDLIRFLTSDQRIEVIRHLPATPSAQFIAADLVNGAPSLYKEFLANNEAKGYHLEPLAGVEGEVWVSFVEAALSAGFDEDTIVSASFPRFDSWTGPESEHYRRRMNQFGAGLQAKDMRIRAIAQKCVDAYESRYNSSIISEKHEAVYGND